MLAAKTASDAVQCQFNLLLISFCCSSWLYCVYFMIYLVLLSLSIVSGVLQVLIISLYSSVTAFVYHTRVQSTTVTK